MIKIARVWSAKRLSLNYNSMCLVCKFFKFDNKMVNIVANNKINNEFEIVKIIANNKYGSK